jgi:hypothetical protein
MERFHVALRYRETFYEIAVRPSGVDDSGMPEVDGVLLDGIVQADGFALLSDDRQEHRVEVRIAKR